MTNKQFSALMLLLAAGFRGIIMALGKFTHDGTSSAAVEIIEDMGLKWEEVVADTNKANSNLEENNNDHPVPHNIKAALRESGIETVAITLLENGLLLFTFPAESSKEQIDTFRKVVPS